MCVCMWFPHLQIAIYDNNGRKFNRINNIVIITQLTITKDSGFTHTNEPVSILIIYCCV